MGYKTKFLIVLAIVVLAALAFYAKNNIRDNIQNNVKNTPPDPTESISISTSTQVVIPSSTPEIPAVTIIAKDLKIPWDMAFLPDGNILVTERPGNLIEIDKDGKKNVLKLPRAVPKGEGGLLGITLHPKFADNHFIYLYMTTQQGAATTKNAVFRYVFTNGVLSDEKTIIKDIPGALYHDGGRLEFGPDGYLYITTGDATISNIAQDVTNLGGKILRVNDDGTIPSDNPFGNAVFSLGHRNPQGLAWDPQGRLWETEHGRSGVLTGMDELNIVEKGKNYGWPTIEGDKVNPGMVTPVVNSGPNKTWAPASALYYKGSIFVGGLKGEALYEFKLDGDKASSTTEHFFQKFGRIRTVRLGPDGMFYITTSNRDDRGKPMTGDDRIIRINPNNLSD